MARSGAPIGHLWPIFADERGEYELLSGDPASERLNSIAQAGNDGYMLPEQVWDNNPPSCTGAGCSFPQGEGTFSVTPLAWSIQAGRPVEQPSIVACRYTRACP